MAWTDLTTQNTGEIIAAAWGNDVKDNFTLLEATQQILDTDHAFVEIVNSAAEESLYSVSVPANTLGSDQALWWIARIRVVNTSGAAGNFTLRIKYGGTTILTAVENVTNGSDAHILLFGKIHGNGTTSSQIAMMGGIGAYDFIDVGIASEDSTGALTFEVTGQMVAASVNASIEYQFSTLAAMRTAR